MNILKVINSIAVAIPFIMAFSILLEAEGKPGDKKKEEVVERLQVQFTKMGLKFPKWLDSYIEPLLGVLVDVVVAVLNKTGFFTHGNEPSENSN